MEDEHLKQCANRIRPVSYASCDLVLKSIGLFQTRARQPVPVWVKSVKEMYETALTLHVGGMKKLSLSDCAVCSCLVRGREGRLERNRKKSSSQPWSWKPELHSIKPCTPAGPNVFTQPFVDTFDSSVSGMASFGSQRAISPAPECHQTQ